MVMGTASDDGRHQKQSLWRKHWAELCLLAFVTTAGAVLLFQHQLFGRDIVAMRGGDLTGFGFDGYTDQFMPGGKSTIVTKEPMIWSCSLRPGSSAVFCAYEIGLDNFG